VWQHNQLLCSVEFAAVRPSTPARHLRPNDMTVGKNNGLVCKAPSRNGHVMIPLCSTLWPLEDVRTSGYCYGWVLNSRLVCVAGVLQVGSLGECAVLSLAYRRTLRRGLLNL
jgi:hypothetical protein